MDNEKIAIIIEAVNRATNELTRVVTGINGVNTATDRQRVVQQRTNAVLTQSSAILNRTRLALLAAGAAMTFYTRSLLNNTDALVKEARALETTVGKLIGVKYAADLAGVSGRQMTISLNQLAQAMEEASEDPAGKLAQRFRDIGIATEGLRNRDPIDVLMEMSGAFSTHSGAAAKAAIAADLLGDRTKVMVNFLNGGSAAIRSATSEVAGMGMALEGTAGENIGRFNDSITRFRYLLMGAATAILANMLPAMISMTEGFIGWLKEGDRAISIANFLTDSFTLLARVSIMLWSGLKTIAIVVGAPFYAAFLNAQTSIRVTIELVRALIDGLFDLGRAVIETMKQFAGLASVAGRVIAGDFVGAWEAAKQTMAGVGTAVADIGRSIAQTYAKSGTLVVEGTGEVVRNIVETAGTAYDEIVKTAEAASAALDSLNKGGPVRVSKAGGGAAGGQPPLGEETFGSNIREAFSDLNKQYERFEGISKGVASTIADSFQAAFSSIGSGISGLIRGTETWAGVLNKIGTSILDSVINGIVSMFAEWMTRRIAQSALTKSLSVAEGATDVAAKAPGAIMTSISSWGVAAAVGLAAVMAALAASGSFASGGYTGSGGKYEARGIVHAGEVVIPSETVKALGPSHFSQNYFPRGMPGYASGGLVGGFNPSGMAAMAGRAGGGSSFDFTFMERQDRNAEREAMARDGYTVLVDKMRRRGNVVKG